MNRRVILLREILADGHLTQRKLAEKTGLSLGSVNALVRELVSLGYLTPGRGSHTVTQAGLLFLSPFKVDCALIMAAGFGARFVPLTFEKPKGLIEVFGVPMIERQITQLIEAGVSQIAIAVGYMKESFEYLSAKYGCELIFNPDYETKNNISSLYHARDFLRGKNAYILSADHWMSVNIFHCYEGEAWYASKYFEGPTDEWTLVTDAAGMITDIYPGGVDTQCMYGPAYFSAAFSDIFMPLLIRMYRLPGTGDYYWENVLMDMVNGTAEKRVRAYCGRIPELLRLKDAGMYINPQPEGTVYEFENLEELREFDPRYLEDSGSEAMQLVSRVLGVPESGIRKIRKLKAGMTNNSWLFEAGGLSFICRIPGKGTDELIDRRAEKASFEAVSGLAVTERVIYFDESSGYKISEYYEGSRNADFSDPADLAACMRLLRWLHESGIRVEHHFDIGERLGFYEELCGGVNGIPFSDYAALRQEKTRLLGWLEEHRQPETFAHIDPVADNFIFLSDGSLRLIDWEYSGMCDPLMDLGMSIIYSFMDEESAGRLMEAYFGREASEDERRLVYAYMALGGLLWALWGVYKEQRGVVFTDYTIKMYRYFRKYSKLVLSS